MERLSVSTRTSPPCGAVFAPRPCASRRASSSRLYARSGQRGGPSDDAQLRSAVLGSVAGVALSFGVFVGGAQADEGLMASPFQGLQEMRERNQQKLDAAEEAFQNSDVLRDLKAKSEANRAANKKAIENKYCYRQAEMGVGDCGGLRFIEGGKLNVFPPGVTTTGLQNPPEFLKKLFGNFFNDIKEIISPKVEEELDEEVAAFEAELAEAVKAIEAIKADLSSMAAPEPAEPKEEPAKPAEPAEPAEPAKEAAAEVVTTTESVETKVVEPEEPAAAAAAPVKSDEPAEKEQPPSDNAEPVKAAEAVETKESAAEAPEPEQTKDSVEPVVPTEAAAPEQSAEPAEPATVSEVVEVVKTESAKPLQVAEVMESSKLAEAIEPSQSTEVNEPVDTAESVQLSDVQEALPAE